jgi:hypothetical protein
VVFKIIIEHVIDQMMILKATLFFWTLNVLLELLVEGVEIE